MQLRSRGVAPTSKLRAFLAEHVAVCGLAKTALRLRTSPATVRGILQGFPSEVRTLLRVLELQKRLGHDRQTWATAVPFVAPPAKRRERRTPKLVAPPEPPKQASLFM
ncbi:MAG: hypothetical protein KA712_16840 [Myxococcales bacterium]|nr:hypothetical protein [Myxococcales bacterium]